MGTALSRKIPPNWDDIDRARDEAVAFLHQQQLHPSIVDAVGMVVGELLENGVKYGRHGSGAPIEYSVTVAPDAVTVEVLSPAVEDDDPHLQRLDRTIQWIRGYQNPFEAYIETLKNIARRPLDDRESGLGLVRIAYEGKSILDFYLTDDNRVAVSAIYRR